MTAFAAAGPGLLAQLLERGMVGEDEHGELPCRCGRDRYRTSHTPSAQSSAGPVRA